MRTGRQEARAFIGAISIDEVEARARPMSELMVEAEEIIAETETVHARSRLDAKAIWAKYNKRR